MLIRYEKSDVETSDIKNVRLDIGLMFDSWSGVVRGRRLEASSVISLQVLQMVGGVFGY